MIAKIHDLFIVELAEVIKGYGNDPDDEDPFRLSEFYRFYELPNIAVSRENFEKMRPAEPQRMKGKWIDCKSSPHWKCSHCGYRAPYFGFEPDDMSEWLSEFCPHCGADMRGERHEAD